MRSFTVAGRVVRQMVRVVDGQGIGHHPRAGVAAFLELPHHQRGDGLGQQRGGGDAHAARHQPRLAVELAEYERALFGQRPEIDGCEVARIQVQIVVEVDDVGLLRQFAGEAWRFVEHHVLPEVLAAVARQVHQPGRAAGQVGVQCPDKAQWRACQRGDGEMNHAHHAAPALRRTSGPVPESGPR